MQAKVAIYGGTFDILHDGHKAIIKDLIKREDLVYLTPTSITYYKKNRVMYSFEERKSNLENWLRTNLSPEEIAKVVVSDVENNKPDNWRFIDTFKTIARRYPRVTIDVAVGADSFINIETWEKYRELIETCNLIVYGRPGYSRDNFPNIYHTFVDMNIDISSTQLRKEIRGMTDEEFEDLLDESWYKDFFDVEKGN